MNVTVVIPTLNEEKGIGEVVEGFRKLGFEVLVIDGNSKDRTREIALEKGAKVVLQSGRGKGNAIAQAFAIVESDVVVLVDGDGSYCAEDVWKLLEPIENGNRGSCYRKQICWLRKGSLYKAQSGRKQAFKSFF
jgi:dolichol-phosphate mannosyltransferase